MFAQEGILNDFTLLGAGTTNGNQGPGSVTLGRIGLGYLYTDFIPQISWTSPTSHGLQLAGGVFEPFSDVFHPNQLSGHSQPQVQGKLTYAIPTKGPIKAKLWTNFITQAMVSNYGNTADVMPVGKGVRATGADYGMKLSLRKADFVAYGYNGWGIGTEGLLFNGFDPTTDKTRPSQGYYLQGTYTLGKRTTVGFSYGQSAMSKADAGDVLPVRTNGSWIGQGRYALTKWVNLVGEYTHTRSEAPPVAEGSNITTSDSVALGSILFF
jgi:hypothetical protein